MSYKEPVKYHILNYPLSSLINTPSNTSPIVYGRVIKTNVTKDNYANIDFTKPEVYVENRTPISNDVYAQSDPLYYRNTLPFNINDGDAVVLPKLESVRIPSLNNPYPSVVHHIQKDVTVIGEAKPISWPTGIGILLGIGLIITWFFNRRRKK